MKNKLFIFTLCLASSLSAMQQKNEIYSVRGGNHSNFNQKINWPLVFIKTKQSKLQVHTNKIYYIPNSNDHSLQELSSDKLGTQKDKRIQIGLELQKVLNKKTSEIEVDFDFNLKKIDNGNEEAAFFIYNPIPTGALGLSCFAKMKHNDSTFFQTIHKLAQEFNDHEQSKLDNK